jgi:hypothetical protein
MNSPSPSHRKQIRPDQSGPNPALPRAQDVPQAPAPRATAKEHGLPALGPMNFPQYTPPPNPSGIPVADYSQSKLLFKAIKLFGKPKVRMPRHKKGLISNDTINITQRKPKFY